MNLKFSFTQTFIILIHSQNVERYFDANIVFSYIFYVKGKGQSVVSYVNFIRAMNSNKLFGLISIHQPLINVLAVPLKQ